MIKAVVFDMDGVIFDSERCVFDVWEELARENNLGDMEPTLRACLGVTTEKCKSIMRSMKGEDFPVEHFMKEASLLFHKRYDGGKLPLKPGVRELLAYLKKQGTRLALASSTRESTVTAELRDAGLYDYFDRVVCGNMVTKSKPDPEIFFLSDSRRRTTYRQKRFNIQYSRFIKISIPSSSKENSKRKNPFKLL